MMSAPALDLRFAIEGEVLLARADTFEPLWHDRLEFGELNALLEGIRTSDIARDGLRTERPHRTSLPYVVEGYDVPAPGAPGVTIGRLPKGLEIRTPVCGSIAAALETYAVLFERLQAALALQGLVAVHLSHHPFATDFSGPRNSPREDYWRWQMAAMTTYGPDVNLGLDPVAFASLNPADLERKFDHYAAAMVAFTLDSPIYGGALWSGKSVRTYRRSPHAPALLILPEEGGRVEFKAFESSASLADLENDLLLFAGVLLDERLGGRAGPAERVHALRQVALHGWGAAGARERAEEVLEAASRSLPDHGLDPAPLERYRRRLELEWVPADETAARFLRAGSVEELLRGSTQLRHDDPLAELAHATAAT